MTERSLFGRVVHVTGAGHGIGRAIARAVARAGAHVAVSDIDDHSARDTAAQVQSAGGVAAAWQLDVSDAARFADVTAQIHERLGPADTLVNNAGVMHRGHFL
ncbi:MAG TPA: SDR family NAD(P)-dependent oxidoreductase, partial [Polyangiaceae bacterium]|nr:SDR family NAD(P)-dependent oxidoreductase [Polyangiaceae bacterium]